MKIGGWVLRSSVALAMVAGGCQRAELPYGRMAGINPVSKVLGVRAGPSDDEIQCGRDAEVQGEFVAKREHRWRVIAAAYQDCLAVHGMPRR
jgi:hypothetical protein